MINEPWERRRRKKAITEGWHAARDTGGREEGGQVDCPYAAGTVLREMEKCNVHTTLPILNSFRRLEAAASPPAPVPEPSPRHGSSLRSSSKGRYPGSPPGPAVPVPLELLWPGKHYWPQSSALKPWRLLSTSLEPGTAVLQVP